MEIFSISQMALREIQLQKKQFGFLGHILVYKATKGSEQSYDFDTRTTHESPLGLLYFCSGNLTMYPNRMSHGFTAPQGPITGTC